MKNSIFRRPDDAEKFLAEAFFSFSIVDKPSFVTIQYNIDMENKFIKLIK